MSIDKDVYCGVYIKFEGTLGKWSSETLDFEESLDEVLHHVSSEGEFDKSNDYWIPNKMNMLKTSINVDDLKEPFPISDIKSEYIINFYKSYKKEIQKIVEYYRVNGIANYSVCFGIIVTYN